MFQGVLVGHLLVMAIALFLGSAVQGVVGLGVGLLLAPVTGLLQPSLLPGVPLCMALLLPILTLLRDRGHTDWSGLRWALPARLPGTAVGLLIVAFASERMIGTVVGVMVLAAVALTARRLELGVTRTRLVAAGVVSGATGTATSISGPPIALLYQHRPPLQVRSTLAVYFACGAAFSLAAVLIAGHLPFSDVVISAALAPALLAGYLASNFANKYLPSRYMRAAMLIVCGASALALIVRSTLF